MSEFNINSSIVTKLPLISVIIPVYNVEAYLNRCVHSVVNQIYKNIEIILVDDGSTDDSSKICDEWAKQDERIRVIHKVNGGQSSARNVGLDKCIGEYILFVDSDDYIEIDALETAFNAIIKEKADIALFNNCEVDINGDVKVNQYNYEDGIYSSNDCFILISDKFKYCHDIVWNKLYKSKLFKNLRFDESLKKYEDTAILPYVYNQANSVVLISKSLYCYYQSENSVMRTEFSQANLVLIDIINRLLCDFEDDEMLENYLIIKSIRLIRRLYLCCDNALLLQPIKNEFNYLYKQMIYKEIKISYQNLFAYTLFYISPHLYKLLLNNFL